MAAVGRGDGRLATAIASWVAVGDEGGSLSAMVISLASFVVFARREMKFSKPPGWSEMLHRTKSF